MADRELETWNVKLETEEGPREHCTQCKAMTEEEYRAWLADKSPGARLLRFIRDEGGCYLVCSRVLYHTIPPSPPRLHSKARRPLGSGTGWS